MSNNQKIQIIPAIIAKNLGDLKDELSLVKGLLPKVQIDMLDAKYTSYKSWPFDDFENFKRISSENEGLPYWVDFDFEADLMIENPMEHLEDFIRAGFSGLIIHLGTISGAEEFLKIKELNQKYDVATGLAFCPSDNISDVLEIGKDADFLQVMGSDNIGHHGEVLDERVYEILKKLRQEFPDKKIGVDIGVDLNTVPKLVLSGADKLVSGSAVFEGDVSDNVNKFRRILSGISG